MSKYRTWTIITLLGICFLLFTLGAIIVFVDPFFHYHRPLKRFTYPLYNQDYQNPGITKHFDYDGILVGSSMTQNFKASWFQEKMGLQVVKTPYSGGSSLNMNIIVNQALKNKPDLTHVFWGLDLHALEKQVDKTRNPLPLYLYDDFLLNDVSYVFNKSVLLNNTVQVFSATKDDSNYATNFDDYSLWHDRYTFSEAAVLDNYSPSKKRDQAEDHFLRLAQVNLETNILPIIQSHPEVTFDIFFPPYSILFWYDRLQNGTLEDTFSELEHVIPELLNYENVGLHYFYNLEGIVDNLYNYKDYTHYSPRVNRYMLEAIADHQHLLTIENYQSEIQKTKDIVTNFDFAQYWDDLAPCKTETEMHEYLRCIKRDRYVVFAVASTKLSFPNKLGAKQLSDLGLTINRHDPVAQLSISRNGHEILQSISDSISITDNTEILDDREISIHANAEEKSLSLEIDKVQYLAQESGLNLVVFDLESNKVIDSVALNPKTNEVIRPVN